MTRKILLKKKKKKKKKKNRIHKGKCSSGLNGTGLPLSSSFESHGIRGFENEAKKKKNVFFRNPFLNIHFHVFNTICEIYTDERVDW